MRQDLHIYFSADFDEMRLTGAGRGCSFARKSLELRGLFNGFGFRDEAATWRKVVLFRGGIASSGKY
eukprot:scaffold54421_cov57-Attheya_sp.AAC.4